VTRTIRISPELWKALKAEAWKSGKTVSRIIEEAVEAYLPDIYSNITQGNTSAGEDSGENDSGDNRLKEKASGHVTIDGIEYFKCEKCGKWVRGQLNFHRHRRTCTG